MKSTIPKKDVINEFFFQDDAFPPHLWDESWEYMKEHNVHIYDSVNDIPYKHFPSVVERHHITGTGGTVIAPKREWNSILIPFSPQYLDEKHFNGRLVSDILYPLIMGAKGKKKFIASCRSWYCFLAEMQNFEYQIFNRVIGTNMIIPFVLYDEIMNYCFGFDDDFEYSFFSSAELEYDDKRLNGTFAEWDAYFVEHFVKTAPTDTNHMELFETVLKPSIPRDFHFS